MTVYNKTKSDPYKISELQREINASTDIVPSCTSITASGDDLAIDMAADLSNAEETALDALIAAHVPPTDFIEVSQLPFSKMDGEDNKKLAVHPSYKPDVDGITTYAVWCGAGDELDGNGDVVDGGEIGGGPILHLDCTTADSDVEVVAKFHPENGRIWLHEAYIKFTDAPEKSYLSGGIIAYATPLQQLGNLDLVIDDDGVVTFSLGGPGTGTHGFADASKIVLVPRTFSHDGNWNYDPTDLVTPLTPNFAGTGEYKIFNKEIVAHRFVNRIPTFGSSPYFSITSDETTELPNNYYVRVCARTTDDTTFANNWHASVVLEIYRERTMRN